MPHVINRGKSGRRDDVDFEGSPLRVEKPSDGLPEERRRFALFNIPLHLFSPATAEAAKRGSTKMQ